MSTLLAAGPFSFSESLVPLSAWRTESAHTEGHERARQRRRPGGGHGMPQYACPQERLWTVMPHKSADMAAVLIRRSKVPKGCKLTEKTSRRLPLIPLLERVVSPRQQHHSVKVRVRAARAVQSSRYGGAV